MTRGARGAHRIEFKISPASVGPKVEFLLDDALTVRLACLEAFSSGKPSPSGRLQPTPYQSGRLALLLAVLDRLEHGDNTFAGTRIIASELIFPGAELPSRAIEWKSSSFRRQTQRVVAAAKSMREHGYRHLLHGQISHSASRISNVPTRA